MTPRPVSGLSLDAERVRQLQEALLARTVARTRLAEVEAEVRALQAYGQLVPVRVESELRQRAAAMSQAEARVTKTLQRVAGDGPFPL